MQRIFKCVEIQNITLTPDKELNISIWTSFLCHYYIQEVQTFKKCVLAHHVYYGNCVCVFLSLICGVMTAFCGMCVNGFLMMCT